MPKKSADEILSDLLKKQEVIKNRIASIESKKRNVEDRVLTRKKILIGAFMIERFKDNQGEFKKFIQEMDSFLTRPLDRKLFGLMVKSV
jgi:hypothetical protein